MRRFALALTVALTLPTALWAQTPALPERAVRRDIPLTNTIRKAFAAGTRDSTGRPGRNYWQLRTDYTIQARLDPQSGRISGQEEVVIHNRSDTPLTSIALRLDPNIFLPTVSRGLSTPAETTDGMLITALSVDGVSADLNASAPTGGRGRGGAGGAAAPGGVMLLGAKLTTAQVRLATPIPAGGSATLKIEWNHKLPGGPGGQGHRMTQRWADTLFQPTQWYPRVAKFDDLRGWDSEPYLGPSEFYNNFGRFDVSIDVPAGWIVSGTGVLQNPQQVLTATARAQLAKVLDSDSTITIVGPDEVGPGQATAAGDRLVWRFVADTVNDFAWATAKKFVWQATRATIPERGRVPIHMLFLPGRANLFDGAGAVARHALEFYSKLWTPYEFPQLTLQDGPSAGMEYPMVINSNRGAADHETAHQWWPMLLGTNETQYGWMDEGFNQYMNILSGADAAGRPANLGRLGQSYGRTSGDEREPIMMWSANNGGPMYGFQTYQKTPLMLSMLGGVVGDSAVQHAMSEYAKTWRFKHPSPWDYMFFMNTALKKDLGWFWYYWLFTTESVDGSIASVANAGIRTTVTVRQDGQMPSPVVLKVEFAPTGAPIRPMRNAVMVDSVTALVTYPVDVWFAGAKTFKADLVFGGRKVVKVTLDPDGRFPDRDPADNVWPKANTAASGRGVTP